MIENRELSEIASPGDQVRIGPNTAFNYGWAGRRGRITEIHYVGCSIELDNGQIVRVAQDRVELPSALEQLAETAG